MPTVYDHELGSYLCEISQVKNEVSNVWERGRQDPDFNLTHFNLGVSNRSNMILVGLCSLVEARLTEIAFEYEQNSTFKLDDETGNGISKVKNFLKKCDAFEFGKLKNWESFLELNTIRNALVHGYGGIVTVKDINKLNDAIKKLRMENILVGARRIRMTTAALRQTHDIVSGLFSELQS